VTLYKQNKVDLVLMDIFMPGTDGLEATLELTRECVGAKIIAMTGAQGDRNFLEVAKLFGARRGFEKPFDLDILVQAINEEVAK
jgi:two-component system, response regulator, stage 0 sporulation protein F